MCDLYQIVTNKIIEQLEDGIIPWTKSQCGTHSNAAFNRITGKNYCLLNQMLLKHSGEYATYNQWKKAGGRVKKGEASEMIVYWKKLGSEEPDNTQTDTSKYVLTYQRVFHISQISGVTPRNRVYSNKSSYRYALADKIMKSYLEKEHIDFTIGGDDEAYYSSLEDIIHIPDVNNFKNTDDYYATLYHEIIHSTGHKNRLNRKGVVTPRLNTDDDFVEELIAEIASKSIMNMFDIETEQSIDNPASYINNWLNIIKNNKRIFILAANRASKASNYVLDKANAKEKV